MSEENQPKEIIEAVTGLVKAVPIYQDALQPAAKELGKSLEVVAKSVNVALAPLKGLVWGYDQFEKFIQTKVSERLKSVPPENIITPKINVAGPAFEALRFNNDEELLSDLYANLLASAMDKSIANGAHPAFVEIIKQLTSDEAKLMSFLSKQIVLPLISLKLEVVAPGQTGNINVLANYSLHGEKAGCELPELTSAYIDNLCRLGLIEIPPTMSYTNKHVYSEIENSPEIKKRTSATLSGGKFKIEHKMLQITSLGKQFIKICLKT